ncbi:uncharacterized protein LOC103930198 isoform X2 [Pyrus x bretschneideri]|uniref:uncharacterized protein LOC103930198 isoform X2 n=1 Tax=Pyrus x bretschneideri TaxID=225117 RepID=UPI0020306CE2|nr:uncharacterized protein LOC103930198 isoform X2 [Pyrus x bretschneideri]
MGLGRKSKGEVWGRLISRDFLLPLHSPRTHLSLRFSHPQIFRFPSRKIPTKETLLLVYFGILFVLSIFRRGANWLRFGFLPFLSNSCVRLLFSRKQCFLLSTTVWRMHDLRISDPRHCFQGTDRSLRQRSLCNHRRENIMVILSSDLDNMWSMQYIHIWINAMDYSQPMDLKFQCVFHHFSYLTLKCVLFM